jgi:hypothetical protein
MIDLAALADAGMNGMMLILLAAASIVSSWSLFTHSLFSFLH